MTLTRGARITGAALCGVLALITGAWIVRDISVSGGLEGLWRYWASDPRREWRIAQQATSPLDGALLAVYAGVGVAVLRSSVAASALVAAAVFTLAVRLPSLWVLTASWAYLQPTDSIRTRALFSTFAVLGLAVGLVITAVAGRRPAEAHDDQGPRAAPHRRTPAGPTVVVAWLAGALLLLEAALVTAWQLRFGYQFGPEVYLDSLVGGERVGQRLLAPPSGWLAATTVVLGLTAGVGLLARAVYSRPLGAVVAVAVLASGAVGVDAAVRLRILQHFGRAPLEYQLLVATSVFELVAGLLLIVLLTRRGESGPAGGSGATSGYGYPQPAPGYGYPPARPGYGYPPSAPPGYGYPHPGSPPGSPSGGGFGPPPPSSPPPNW
ncbi:hypothetical protein ACH46N_26560 [Streptomyces pristinaespiralis]|uniref:Uncharacterized protein n=1 Tax=Streptomyces pristinaespiralis TaxID=38300 RepID=A0A0M5IQ77_STRPR|nr:hypothetical protein [Streptomyces pristinaespiralis]ALC21061.1 hypothetical protein SPRI_2755 [Streptomyces pristinaespiralis]QMU16172.1 hypothetical protein H3L99_23230 [Streptomyces pristinaespiralis]